MGVKLCGNRVHFTFVHFFKISKYALICIALLTMMSIVRYLNVPLNISIYELDDYNRQSHNYSDYDYLPIHKNHLTGKGFSGNQDQLDYIASYLNIFIQPITNEMGRFYYNVKLTNTGDQYINNCCWTIYLYSSKMLDCSGISMNYGLITSLEAKNMLNQYEWSHNDLGPYHFDSNHSFIVSHVIGYTFKMKPSVKFQPMKPMETRIIRFSGFGWSVSKSEFIPNWYVANDRNLTLKPRVLQSTVGENLKFIGDFRAEGSKIRFEQDKFRPLTPMQRYNMNIVKRRRLPHISIIPTPVSAKLKEPYKVIVNADWRILYMSELESEAKHLKDKLQLKLDLYELDRETMDNSSFSNVIILKLADKRDIQMIRMVLLDHSSKDVERAYVLNSAYELVVNSDKIEIKAVSPSGAFYGLVTFLNLLESTPFLGEPLNVEICSSIIVDAPRFRHRGLMIDVSRNFFPIESMLKILEVMAIYKMNVLHLHLSDDEGWRLEIPGLPELTKVGGQRDHDPLEVNNLMSLLGSGPQKELNSGSGFYSVKEFRTLLQFATRRHITIIPEFDMPSHSHAAIVSMKARHRATKMKIPKKDYLVSDLHDTSIYSTGQFYSSSAINPCLRSTYRFVHHILKELVQIYKGVAPLNYFHLGGDEVPKDAYAGSEACQKLQSTINQKSQSLFGGTTALNLKTYFIENVARLARKFNLSLIGWDDAFLNSDGSLMSFKDNLKNTNDMNNNNNNNNNAESKINSGVKSSIGSQEIVAQYYYNIWEQGLASKPYIMADRGMKVILSPITSLYFDSPQEPDPDDWGLHWASRYTDTRRAYYFTPNNLYNSIDFSFDGERISKTFVCSQHPCHKLQKPENILGIEAAMWSELIRTPERMHSMLFPRLLAVAERSWHEARWENELRDDLRLAKKKKNWDQFAVTVGAKELRRLESMGISYYLPRPGVIFGVNGLHVNTMFPGMNVQVSRDNGQTWENFNETESLARATSLLFSTTSFDGKRRSFPVEVSTQIKEKGFNHENKEKYSKNV